MKSLLTAVCTSCVFLLSAQSLTFQPAQSLVNENAVASLNFDFSDFYEVAKTEKVVELEEVEDYFDISFSANPIFGDLNVNYTLAQSSDVTLLVTRDGLPIFTSTKPQNSGTQTMLWDENISTGSGVHTIQIIANNKVESIRITL